jgi:hypothetical protein
MFPTSTASISKSAQIDCMIIRFSINRNTEIFDMLLLRMTIAALGSPKSGSAGEAA